MPTVDVIIPAYNAARYLRIAIESVIAQTFDDWRIILVDDGSTDNTAEVVAPFIEQLGPKLKYIKQANRGLPGARNVAIQNSTAEFLALLDADDVWLPCRLEESLKSFEGRPQVGLSYGFVTRVDTEGVKIDTFARRQKHAEGWIAPYIYMRETDMVCPSVTFRRKCVDDVGDFDESFRATEDRDLWLRIALRYEVALVPTMIAYYRVSPNSMSTDPERMLKAQLKFAKKHYGAPGCGFLQRQIALGRIYKQHAEALLLKQHAEDPGNRSQLRPALMSSLRSIAFYPLDIGNARSAGSMLLRYAGLSRSSI
jgi:glycosyltransferase involved in cell wall biosynthesis